MITSQDAMTFINRIIKEQHRCFMVFWRVKESPGNKKVIPATGHKFAQRYYAEKEMCEMQDDPRYAGEEFFVMEVEE